MRITLEKRKLNLKCIKLLKLSSIDELYTKILRVLALFKFTPSVGPVCGSGIQCLFDPWILENGMNIPDHISESLGTIFKVKNT